MTKYLVKYEEQCPHCHGKGWIREGHCMTCGEPTDRHIALRLPCGHLIRHFSEERTCPKCNGHGKLDAWVSLTKALTELGFN